MKSKETITLKLAAALNAQGQIYSFSVSVDPQESTGNAFQFPIEVKKGEINKMITKFNSTTNIANQKDIILYVTIQNKTFVNHTVCKTEPITNPPTTPPNCEHQ